MNFHVQPDGEGHQGRLKVGGREFRCALGRHGIVAGPDKQEGDGKTPAGAWPLRTVLFRPDRLEAPATRLAIHPLRPLDAWCDDPASPFYNQKIAWPGSASAERLWRDDDLYDLVVVVGHNVHPIIVGRGSAIFLHVATPDFAPTAGCVALSRRDLLVALALADADSALIIPRPG